MNPNALSYGLLAVAVFAAVLLAWWRGPVDATEPPVSAYAALAAPRDMPRLPLIDAQGDRRWLSEISSDLTLVFFGFTRCPDVCPTTLSILNLALDGLEQPPAVVMVSVDPDSDSPASVSRYAAAFNEHFIGLTGTDENLRAIADAVAIDFARVAFPEGGYSIEHSSAVVVLDEAGRHIGYLRAPHNPEAIRSAIEALRLERTK